MSPTSRRRRPRLSVRARYRDAKVEIDARERPAIVALVLVLFGAILTAGAVGLVVWRL